MTLDEFIEKLRETPRTWETRGDGRIRLGGCCPISSLRMTEADYWLRVSQELGLDRDLAETIVIAADNWDHHDAPLRARLLDACGLVEP